MTEKKPGNPPIERQESPPERNLLNAFDSTLSAMAEIEGEEWLDSQRDPKKELSAGRALKFLKEQHQEYEQLPDDSWRKEDFMEETSVFEIYGRGGGNRWFVDMDGRVVFSEMHCYDDHIKNKAKKLGFESR